MTGWTETFRGVVYPWHCDHLGHMNVQHYTGMFDQAAFHLMSKLGFRSIDMHGQDTSFVDAQHTVKFLNEQPVGSLVRIDSAVLKIGKKSLTVLHRMTNTETELVAATSEVVHVHFDLKERKSTPIPEAIREHALSFVADPQTLE